MTMTLRAVGDRAVMVELDDAAERRRLDLALQHASVDGLLEHVPAARTVLLRCFTPDDVNRVVARVRTLDLTSADADSGADSDVVEIRVRYDGEDLDHVAEIVGLSRREVVERHTGQLWTVEFAGFMPGFGYLSGASGGLTVPRRESPRTRIPAGSVALAGDFTGLYPQASPGGWQLIGTTDAELWNVERQPPALLVPGATIRFVEVGE